MTHSPHNAKSVDAKVGPLLAAWIDSHHYGSGREFYRHFSRSLDPARPARQAALQHKRRHPRKPTLATVAKQARKAAIAVVRYEVKPDGSIVIVTTEGEPIEANNPWLVDLPKVRR
jgi:hypothetical protein